MTIGRVESLSRRLYRFRLQNTRQRKLVNEEKMSSASAERYKYHVVASEGAAADGGGGDDGSFPMPTGDVRRSALCTPLPSLTDN